MIHCKSTIARTLTLATALVFAGLIAYASGPLQSRSRRTVGYTDIAQGHNVQCHAYLLNEVDQPPVYPKGDRAMIAFINKERHYPRQAYLDGVEGRVLCGFIVKPDGSISHASVVKGVEPTLDAEALRIIGRMPKWQPGLIDGSAVAVYYMLAIPFRL